MHRDLAVELNHFVKITLRAVIEVIIDTIEFVLVPQFYCQVRIGLAWATIQVHVFTRKVGGIEYVNSENDALRFQDEVLVKKGGGSLIVALMRINPFILPTTRQSGSMNSSPTFEPSESS